MRISPRTVVTWLVGTATILLVAVALLWVVSIRMPGSSHSGALSALTPDQEALSGRLREHVTVLAGTIGERNSTRMRALDSAAEYVRSTLAGMGYAVDEQTYVAGGQTYRNIEATVTGRSRPTEIVVVGGHYDSAPGTPGADDNASGTAGMLEIARSFSGATPERTIRFVGFVNEEEPFFQTEDMGSLRYARAARARGDDIVAMLSIETIGYYLDAPGSQQYPAILGLFYPDRGNFIGFVGNIGSRAFVHRVVDAFRSAAAFPSAGTAAPSQIPGISWSDQWSFWEQGYDGVMITDTAPFRNPNYHAVTDLPDSLDYGHMARVVDGVRAVVQRLASSETFTR